MVEATAIMEPFLFVNALFFSPFGPRLDGIDQCAPRHGFEEEQDQYRRNNLVSLDKRIKKIRVSTYLNPAFSRAWTPAIVVPPGEHTFPYIILLGKEKGKILENHEAFLFLNVGTVISQRSRMTLGIENHFGRSINRLSGTLGSALSRDSHFYGSVGEGLNRHIDLIMSRRENN